MKLGETTMVELNAQQTIDYCEPRIFFEVIEQNIVRAVSTCRKLQLSDARAWPTVSAELDALLGHIAFLQRGQEQFEFRVRKVDLRKWFERTFAFNFEIQ
jgi:hypothetical protein